MATPSTNKKLFISGPRLRFEIEIPCTASILQLKQNIKDIAKVAVDRQTLFFNDMWVDNDNYILRDVVHPQHAVLELRVAPLPGNPSFVIFAKSLSREDDITVKETQSVDHLRNEISRRWGISPPTKITLLRLNHPMQDGHLLSDYFICEGAEILVLIFP